MEDDFVLTSPVAAASHDTIKSPPPYSLQSTPADFGNNIPYHCHIVTLPVCVLVLYSRLHVRADPSPDQVV